jgi:hypothetical protein
VLADPARSPSPSAVWGIALAGCAATAVATALALTSDHVDEPGVQATLVGWIGLGYVVSGAIAWWRRPDSRFGPLMIASGFTFFLSVLSWSNASVPYTVGIFFDLVPAAIYIHVFLAFPDGRLERRVERWVVGAAYFVALGLQVVGLLLNGFGPDDAIAVWDAAGAAYTLLRIQLVTLGGLCIVACPARWSWSAATPRSRRCGARRSS